MSDDDVGDSLIPYDDIVQEALRAVVGRVLGQVAQSGLPGGHHFYITYKTHAPGVVIPQHLAERFPDEITIVLQNKFWDLFVGDDQFAVSLTFNQVPANLVVPFAAITAFVDPAVNFALQFHVAENDVEGDGPGTAENDPRAGTADVKLPDDGSNVVTVDFGKKK